MATFFLNGTRKSRQTFGHILIYNMKIVTIIGTRPQFIKAATVSRAIGSKPETIHEVIVNTGQHYDYNLSRVFFEQMSIPEPHHHLEVGSGSHANMTGRMLSSAEAVIIEERPEWVLVYGDTNSTLAGALAAAKLHIPVAHVEAGLRSFNRAMPEEINRVLTDHLSQLLFTPTDTATANLNKEGIVEGVTYVGDVMYDAFEFHRNPISDRAAVLAKLDLKPKSYFLATIHRQENTDDVRRLSNIFNAFDTIGAENCPLVIPLHPRTRKALNDLNLEITSNSRIRLIEPVGYLDMIQLESNARIIFTDSGGIQKEAYFAGVPCVTLRDETEWVETVESGVNFLAGADTDAIFAAYKKTLNVDVKLMEGLYGDGHAAEKIVDALISNSYEWIRSL